MILRGRPSFRDRHAKITPLRRASCYRAPSRKGELVTGFDEIQALLASERERAAKSARAAQRRLADSLREAEATAQPCPHCRKPVIVVTALQAPPAASTTHSAGPPGGTP